ncbi:MAG: hypothetical protein JST19_05920 [Bacteroidetes bacterium]|nr:hypothetical protein [Bacteroidota bacterium]
MLLLGLIGFCTLVIGIAIVTARLNEKTPCDHDWAETDKGYKCTKCFRRISHQAIEKEELNEEPYIMEEA